MFRRKQRATRAQPINAAMSTLAVQAAGAAAIAMASATAPLDLPRTLDRLWGTFPSYDAIGRLEAPMDFMNSVGVLLPMELWGRCVLYSCLNASHFTWASANDKNQF